LLILIYDESRSLFLNLQRAGNIEFNDFEPVEPGAAMGITDDMGQRMSATKSIQNELYQTIMYLREEFIGHE
jgi:hypothetical protein